MSYIQVSLNMFPGLGAETSMSAQRGAAPASLTLTAGICTDLITAPAWLASLETPS